MIERPLKRTERLDYKETIIGVLRSGPMDLDEMKRRLRIIDLLEQANNVVEMADDDWIHVLGLLRKWRWPIAHPEIIQFMQDMEG